MQNLCSRLNCLGYFNSLSRFINKNKYDLVIYPSLSYYLYNHGSTLTKGDSAMTASLITIAYLTDTYLLTPNIQRLKRSYYDKTYYNTRYIVKQAHFKDAQGINQVLVTKCDNLNWTGWKKIRTVDGSTVNGNLRLVDKDGNKVRDIDHIYYHIYDKYGGFEMLNIKVNTLIHCIESKTNKVFFGRKLLKSAILQFGKLFFKLAFPALYLIQVHKFALIKFTKNYT